MRSWLLLLAGPIVWATHFLAIYAVASVAVQVDQADAAWPRGTILALTVLAILVLLGALALGRARNGALTAFKRSLSRAGAALSAVAIIWQSLPALTN